MAFPLCRSVLLTPGNRASLLAKLLSSGADIAVADLEDGVPADDAAKAEARQIVRAWLADPSWPDEAPPIFLRVNAPDGPWLGDDLALARSPRVAGIVVPKVSDVIALLAIRDELNGFPDRSVPLFIAGVETARGVANAEVIVRSEVADAMYFGAEDYITDLGGRRTHAGHEVLYARSRVALAAATGGIPAIDQACVDFLDDELFVDDAAVGRDLGYRGKLCIHPRQLALAARVFSPSEDEVATARTILAAADCVSARRTGVMNVGGRMIDAPLVARARAVVGSVSVVGVGTSAGPDK